MVSIVDQYKFFGLNPIFNEVITNYSPKKNKIGEMLTELNPIKKCRNIQQRNNG